MKIAVIGGGSTYTPELVEGLALWNLSGGPTEVVLHDLDDHRLEMVTAFCGRMTSTPSSASPRPAPSTRPSPTPPSSSSRSASADSGSGTTTS